CCHPAESTCAAGVEDSPFVAIAHAETEGIVRTVGFRRRFSSEKEFHRTHFLERVTREMLRIVLPHETDIGLRFGNGSDKQSLDELLFAPSRDRARVISMPASVLNSMPAT